jgi:hypothetical protein
MEVPVFIKHSGKALAIGCKKTAFFLLMFYNNERQTAIGGSSYEQTD